MKRLVVLPLLLLTSMALAQTPAPTPFQGFKDETSLGLSVVSGNSNSQSYNAKQLSEYDWEKNVIRASGHYLEAQANGVESALNWDAVLRYERALSDSFNIFTSYGLDSDYYAGYVQKNNFDLGGKYFLIKSDEFTWSAEAGYRYSTTHFPASLTTGVSLPDNNASSARLYTEGVENLNKTATFKLTVEYIQTLVSSLTSAVPNYSTAQDYYLNVEPSLNLMFTQILSMKTSYLFKYANFLPPGTTATKYVETTLTTSLVAKF
jgi:putative salt-induced outer membrane protein